MYKRPDFIDVFKKVWVLEKIHGSSSHISFSTNGLHIFSGGADHAHFSTLFNKNDLLKTYNEHHGESLKGKEVTLYGEVFGGKMHGMSATYGKELKFIVFDVKIEDKWLDLPDAARLAKVFGQEFVWYQLIENTLENLNKYRDQPSQQAIRNGCGDDKKAEGIVAKPLYECYDKNGGRWLIKHKRPDFSEVKTPREVTSDGLIILSGSNEVAEHWVTPMRLVHVMDKLKPTGLEDIPKLITAMKEDVKAESEGEIDWTYGKHIMKAISRKTIQLYKEYLGSLLQE